jgi:DNA-binding HxlR family transcriptional regulator
MLGSATFTMNKSRLASTTPAQTIARTSAGAAAGLVAFGDEARLVDSIMERTLDWLSSIMQPSSLEGMERKSFAGMHCSVAQCLEAVGEWWSMLIVRDAFLGVTRFDEFQQRLGISRNILNQRLTHLAGHGVLQKTRYSEHPPRYEYRLTAKGRDLWPVLTAMRQWGDTYAAPDGPPLQLVHKSCGQIADAVMTCSGCGERLTARDVRAVPGPGDLDDLAQAAGTTR